MRIKWYLNRTKRNQDTQQQQLGSMVVGTMTVMKRVRQKKNNVYRRERGTHIKYAVKVIVVLFALAF